jgi:hypothetical protein
MRNIGKSGSHALFTDDKNAVIVDLDENIVVESGPVSSLTASANWEESSIDETSAAFELAQAALTTLDVTVIAAASRLYTIPKAAQAEAKKALEWRKEHKRGGTPVGLNTARTLAEGGQIGIEKVRHIAKYFPRHEVDKKAKGYEPGEPGFPSNGRIAWALWGGDAAWRWAQQIVERENKKALKADGYALHGYEDDTYTIVSDSNYDADLELFNDKLDVDAVEFVARMRMDGSGIDRLYKIEEDLSVAVWDAGHWHTLAGVDPDLVSYDLALDEFDNNVEYSHVEIDPESALFLSACFQENPNEPVSLFDVNYEEAELILKAAAELDLEFLDKTIIAVGAPTTPAGDGVYTPEERSQKAQKQVRDKTGKFAKQGGRVVVAGDSTKRGSIVAINPAKASVTVKLDSTGKTVEVPANATEPEGTSVPGVQSAPLPEILGLDTTGILGQPRTPIDRPYTQLPGTLPRMTQEDIAKMQSDWPAFVKEQRDAYNANKGTGTSGTKLITGPGQVQQFEKPQFLKDLEELTGVKLITDPYEHPALKNFLNKKVKGSDGKYYYPNKLYYQPAISAVPKGTTAAAGAKPGESVELTPETSDVQPIFFAIVSSDDPSAVMDLVSLVPASSTTTDAMTYVRRDKKWVRDEAILVDMNSPTPPPVVPLDAASLKSVIEQVDGITSVAASVAPDEEFITVLWGKGGNVMFLASPSEDALTAAGIIVAEEQELADALIEITQKHGKFNSDDSGVWAGYESAEENENKEIGVNCANCMLYAGGDVCKIIEQPVEPMGYCRFALISDGIVKPLQAAGGADQNRGNAENLRRYWTIGKGGLKIRWATPGDWTRCYRNLKKYMGPRAKGYCSLRHKEMTGMWPGDKRNPGIRKGAFAMDDILTSEQIIDAAILSARANNARNRVVTAGAEVEYADGGKFSIPLVIPEVIESGDGRRFEKGAIEIRELPLPLMWQIKSAEGHNGSVVVGRIDHMERVENGIGNATGVFDQGEYGQEAERLVRNGFIRGVSADLDQFEASQETDLKDNQQEDSGKIGTDKLVITHARVMAVTLVPKPAFQECQIYLVEDEKQEDTVIPDGIYVDEMDAVEASALVACGIVAGSIPVVPPRSWFADPKLNKATPLTVDDEGRVFGHIAAWHVDHIGMSFGTKPPRSRSKYAYFHTGVVRTDDGKDVPVGQLTLAGGHASLEASASEAVRHYDDTASAIADVHAGEDAYGIWVAGALRPGTTPEQVRALRASAPSGDWRPVKGQLELVAVCQVNVPGFPIARARVASGAVMALVAAGAGVLARMKSDPVAELSARVQKLEQLEDAELSLKAEAAREKFNVVREQKAAQLSALADAAYARIHGEPKYDDEFGYISREKRQALAKKGYALPDGSYPITNVDSLKDSIQAYGRSKPGKRAAVRRHIMKRARALDKADLIPEKWQKASASLIDEDLADIRTRLAEFSSKIENTGEELGKALAVEVQDQGKYTPETQPRDAKGKFRVVLARLKSNLGDTGSDEAIKKIEEVENLDDAGNYLDAARSAGDLISIVDRIDTGALDSKSLENVRSSARALGEVIANLPLPFGSDTEKVRYSDLPPALKGLIDDMISRVEDKIGKKDADEATVDLKSFMSGGDYYSQAEISSQMSKLLRLLT